MKDELLPVMQEDREAAWPFRPRSYPVARFDAWHAGRYDRRAVIQAFARHRIAAMGERESQ